MPGFRPPYQNLPCHRRDKDRHVHRVSCPSSHTYTLHATPIRCHLSLLFPHATTRDLKLCCSERGMLPFARQPNDRIAMGGQCQPAYLCGQRENDCAAIARFTKQVAAELEVHAHVSQHFAQLCATEVSCQEAQKAAQGAWRRESCNPTRALAFFETL